MKPRITQVAILAIVLLVGSGFLLLSRHLLQNLEEQSFQASEELMVDTSHRIAEHITKKLPDSSQLTPESCRELFSYFEQRELQSAIPLYRQKKTQISLHFYLSDQSGTVVFDSQSGQREGQDFSQFNDVLRTLNGGYGARSSRADEDDSTSSILYVAAPIHREGRTIGVVTSYKPQRDLLPFIQSRKTQILKISLMIGSGITILIAAVFFWIYRPIGILTRYTNAITNGQHPSYPDLGSSREINTLGQALKTMRSTLDGREYAEQYVQTLSHELKSPIAAIKATAELLEDDIPQAQRQKFLHSISQQITRSERVISMLQQLSRIEKMHELERMDAIDISATLRHLCEEYQSQAEHKSCRIILDDQLPPEAQITGDPFLIRAALQNLIDNAINYSPGHQPINIQTSDSSASLQIHISNFGDALPDYVEKRIFERFFSQAQYNQSKSSGLGLAIASEAIKLHHGSLEYQYIQSQHCFSIVLNKLKI